MELSRQQLASLLENLELDRDATEVRRSSRTVLRRGVKIIPQGQHSGSSEIDVVLQDISRGGIRISHHEGLPKGKKFVLTLKVAGNVTRMSCVVCHCEMVKQHLFQIGAKFTNNGANAAAVEDASSTAAN
jgi:hypothetical protein